MHRPTPSTSEPASRPPREERLGIVDYTNVAPLHWGLEPVETGDHALRFRRGVPTELNRALLDGEIDLTLISSIEFLRHRHVLKALPDFSIASLGPVYSVVLFHRGAWPDLDGSRIAVSTDSATSIELLRVLLSADGMQAELVAVPPRLESMLQEADAALLIGDAALVEAVRRRPVDGEPVRQTDLGAAWYRLTRLPFTFAVWASRRDRPPSATLVAELRAARERGLGSLHDVALVEAEKRGISPAVVQKYLANFRYYLEPPDRDGLLAFARMALPAFDGTLPFWDL